MNYVTVENLSKTFGIKTLFHDVTFHINEGDKIALVAKNGSGKSTLLKIITGKEVPSEGEVRISKEIQVVLFDQEIPFDPNLSVEDFMMSLESPAIAALRNYHKAIHSGSPEEMEKALLAMESQKAWDLENEMKQILSQLKIQNLEAKMGTLSGGQVKRVALAKLLTETRAEHRHVLLIMDEPTNHLDVDMVEWLENYLSKSKVTLLLVSHDRYFLDSVCDTLWELENQNLYIHKGSYATYLENKMLRQENESTVIDKAQNLYRKELEWMRRQPKARTTKSKSRIEAFYKTEKVAKSSLREDQLDWQFEVKRLGNKILELDKISKSYGSNVLIKDFSYQFQKGEKIGIVGKNGAGKSTLLNILQEIEPLDSGKIEKGETIAFGYFSQKGLNLNPEMRVIDSVKEISENFPVSGGRTITAAQFLRQFLFDDATQYTPISKLSGGEKRRLHLLHVLYKNPNFLIFDEPTNDLDLPTLTVLENFLQNFPGTLLIVSHDRYFMDRIVDRILAFEGDGYIGNFTGNFSEYRQFIKEKSQVEKTVAPNLSTSQEDNESKANPNTKKKLSYKETRELETIEKRLPELEKQKKALLEALEGETDYEKIAPISEELRILSEELDEMELRWLELQEPID